MIKMHLLGKALSIFLICSQYQTGLIASEHSDPKQLGDFRQHTDVYFSRSKHILEKLGFQNVKTLFQVFARDNAKLYGMNQAIQSIQLFSPAFEKNDGRLWVQTEGSELRAKKPVLMGEGFITDIVELETIYLGYLSGLTSIQNGIKPVEDEEVRSITKDVVEAADGRPVIALGARHWLPEKNSSFGNASALGGASGSSTPAAAKYFKNSQAFGTIPHALENMFAWIFGKADAVWSTTLAFATYFPSLKTIALVDYNNQEISDSVKSCHKLREHGFELDGVRIDTSASHRMQGVDGTEPLPDGINPKYWNGKGVSIAGVLKVRQALDANNCEDVGIYLSSGFSNPQKVAAFSNASKILPSLNSSPFKIKSLKSFKNTKTKRKFEFIEGIGAGMMPSRVVTYTMDIVAVGSKTKAEKFRLFQHVCEQLGINKGFQIEKNEPQEKLGSLGQISSHLEPVSKVGREFWENPMLKQLPKN